MTDPATGAAAILDLGCGGGAPIGAELLRRGFVTTGIDNSPSLIRHARMSLSDGTWLVDYKRRFDPLSVRRNRRPAQLLPPRSRRSADHDFVLRQAGPARRIDHVHVQLGSGRGLGRVAGFGAIEFIDADPVAFVWLGDMREMTMAKLDVEVLRAQIRSSDHPRGTPEQIAIWREDMGESRANLAIEGMNLDAEDEALFAMMLDEGLSPGAMVEVICGLYRQPDEAW